MCTSFTCFKSTGQRRRQHHTAALPTSQGALLSGSPRPRPIAVCHLAVYSALLVLLNQQRKEGEAAYGLMWISAPAWPLPGDFLAGQGLRGLWVVLTEVLTGQPAGFGLTGNPLSP